MLFLSSHARHRLGHYLHLDANYLAIRNEKGIAERVVGCITDLTPRILAEEAQIRAERNFHQLFHDVPLGLVVIGPDLRIVECNQSFATMLGYQNDELHNRHLGTLADMSEWSELQNRPHDDDLHFPFASFQAW